MPKNCDTCKYDLFRLCGEEDKTPCDDCYNGNPPTKWEPGENYEPMTKADRIRAMTDEELADFMARRNVTESCLRLADEGYTPTEEQKQVLYDSLYPVWMEWMQAPAEGA